MMVLLKSKSKYSSQALIFVSILLTLVVLNLIIDFPFSNWKVLIGVSIFLLCVFFSSKKIESLSFTDNYFSIIYTLLFFRKKYETEKKNITLSIIERSSFRGGKTVTLQVSNDKKIIFEIDERDGFTKFDFELFISSFNSGKKTLDDEVAVATNLASFPDE